MSGTHEGESRRGAHWLAWVALALIALLFLVALIALPESETGASTGRPPGHARAHPSRVLT